MAGEKIARGTYRTKTCPRCGDVLYGDMHICYGCLYDFSRDRSREPPGIPVLTEHVEQEGLSPDALESAHKDEPGMVVRTPHADVWTPVSSKGVMVGRDPASDVALHVPSVSHHHLRVRSTPDGMEVTDLGSTNPATYQGRAITRPTVVSYGDAIDVCGTMLIMTGRASDEYRSDV